MTIDGQTLEGQGTTTQTPTVQNPPSGTAGGGKVQIIPQHAIGEMKREQREKGKRQALKELEEKAKAEGFSSVDEMIQFASESRKKQGQRQAAPQPTPQARREPTQPKPVQNPPKNRQDRQAMDRSDRDLRRVQEENARLKQKAQNEERRRREADKARQAAEARSELERSAVAAGVQDVDYAVHLLEKHVRGLSEEAIEAFDESKFFEDLRTEKPHLFGVTHVPATTGTGPGNARPVSAARATNGTVTQPDAMKMSREEYQEHLRRRGLGIALPAGTS